MIRPFIKILVLLLICSTEFVFVHDILFHTEDSLVNITGFIVFIQAFLCLGIFAFLNKYIFMSINILNNLIFLFLVIYHRIFDQAVTLKVIGNQFQEGIEYFIKSLNVLSEKNSVFIISYVIISSILIYKMYPEEYKSKKSSIIFLSSFVIIGLFSVFNYRHQKFIVKDFNAMTKTFGYGQGWLYELVSTFDENQQISAVIKMSQEPPQNLPDELIDLKTHNHIYVIQLESMHYDAFEKYNNNQAVMPFLQSIRENAAVYKILKNQPHPSANSDFAAMNGIYNILDFNYVVYQSKSPQELYKYIAPITWKYKEKGYFTDFYHGYYGHFYQRKDYIKAMKFDDIYFAEELQNKYSSRLGEWGIEDADVVDWIIKNQQIKRPEKSFTFFITVSTHDPYNIGNRYTGIYKEPKNILERYYNSFNYVDKQLKDLIDSAPKDSLFIMYSDHPSLSELSSDTFFMIYSKQQKLSDQREINFSQALQIIKSILYYNTK